MVATKHWRSSDKVKRGAFLLAESHPREHPMQVKRQLVSQNIYGETQLMLSVRAGSADVFLAIVGCLPEMQASGTAFGYKLVHMDLRRTRRKAP